jgi:hypothetical protein
VLAVLLATFVLIDGHFLLTLELEIIDEDSRVCHPKRWAQHFVGKIFVFIDGLKYSAIPFCILFVLSILIIQRVFHAEGISAKLQNLHQLHQYRQYSLASSSHLTSGSSLLAMQSSSLNNTRVGRRVTFMLLSVSIAFCIFSAPMSLMQIVQSIMKPDSYEILLTIGKAVAELCQYINHSCNFFLYALTGRIFRREFVRLFFPTRMGVFNPGPLNTARPARPTMTPKIALAVTNCHASMYFMDHSRPNLYHTSQKVDTLYVTKPVHRPTSPSLNVQSPLLLKHNSSYDLHKQKHKKSSIIHAENQHRNRWMPLRQLFVQQHEQQSIIRQPFFRFQTLKPAKSKVTLL